MKKKLPFSIIYNNNNIDVDFQLHDNTNNIEKTSDLLEQILNTIDSMTKKTGGITEGDIFQSLSLAFGVRISISKFDNEQLIQFFNKSVLNAVTDFKKAKKTKIGRA
tara:strand:+ start:947 stop:1267 length:321 start_codon:yes stop_codon:yes gene_type:complete